MLVAWLALDGVAAAEWRVEVVPTPGHVTAVETIGREVFWQVPNDFATMVEARNNGVPLCTQAPRSKLTRSLEQLAQQLDQSAAKSEDEKKPRKGLFGFLVSGK